MKIEKELYYKIITICPAAPTETGGIIGAKSEIITEFVPDTTHSEYGKYTPDTEMINRIIVSWEERNINFRGIYHSHYPENNRLSQTDVEYIKKIMLSVCNIYSFLYFPIVIPQESITVYKAEIKNNAIVITNDKLQIIS